MKKKNLTFLKTKNMLHSFPIIIIMQHNNLTVKEWSRLRVDIKQLDSSQCSMENVCMLLLKNSVIENIALTGFSVPSINRERTLSSREHSISLSSIDCSEKKMKLQSMFQGPCVAIGCINFSQLLKVVRILKITPKILMIGALLNKQFVTHLDLNKLVTLNKSVYNSLIESLSPTNLLCNLLQYPLHFQPLQQVQTNLIHCLSFIKNIT